MQIAVTSLLLSAWLAVLAPTASPYFPHLTRPLAPALQVGGDGGPVILIVVDAMRPDRLSPYGALRDTTPHLAALADDGVLMRDYFVNANWTRPSMASLLTGVLPSVHGVEQERDRLGAERPTLPALLQAHGIATGAVVGNGNAGSAFGLDRGFADYADSVHHWKGLPSAAEVVDLGLTFVRAHRQEPFFLLLFCVDPHDPYHAPPAYENLFVLPGAPPLVRTPRWEGRRYGAATVARMQATYDGALRYTDAELGRFFASLRQLGLYERSTILVTADHGEAFGEHGTFLHSHHLYDELIRAPMVLRAPRMDRRGVVSPHLFQSLDVMPTVLRHFAVEPPAALPGLYLLAAMATPAANDPDRHLVAEFNNFGIRRRSLRSRHAKLVQALPADAALFAASVGDRRLLPSVNFEREIWTAYDLDQDAGEQHNLYTPSLGRQAPWSSLMRELSAQPWPTVQGHPSPVITQLDAETRADLQTLGYIQ